MGKLQKVSFFDTHTAFSRIVIIVFSPSRFSLLTKMTYSDAFFKSGAADAVFAIFTFIALEKGEKLFLRVFFHKVLLLSNKV